MTACSLALHDISHSYRRGDGELAVLDGISLEVAAGEFVSIVGPSGCGKSTLLRIIGGLLEPTVGEILIDREAPKRAQQGMKVGYVFQEPALLPWRNVRQNIELPLDTRGGRRREITGNTTSQISAGVDHPHPNPLAQGRGSRAGLLTAKPKTSNADKTQGLVELVGLTDFADYPPRQLSGGMQQRVAIARALSFDPPLLLMDEPFGALDEITREAMRADLQRIWARDRKTVVFVTHSLREAILLSDRVIVLSPRPGRIVAETAVELPRPREAAAETSPEFARYLEQMRSALKVAA